MVTKLLFTFALLFITNISSPIYSQFARSFYSTNATTHMNNGVFYYSGNINAVSIKESTQDSLKIMLIELDDEGNTSNYRFFEVPCVTGADQLISGTAVLGNKLIVNIVYVQGTFGKITTIQINLDTEVVSALSTLTEQFIRGAVKSVQKQDSLITYTSLFDGSIVRLSTSINTPSTYSIEQTSQIYNIASPYSINREPFMLMIDGVDEYFYHENKLEKRSGLGIYSYTTIPSTNSFTKSIVKNNNGEIILQCRNYIYRLSTSLILLGQRFFPVPSNNSHRVYFNGQNTIAYIKSSTNQYIKYTLNNDLSTIDSVFSNVHFNIQGSYSLGNYTYLYGSKTEPITLNITPFGVQSGSIFSSFVMKDLNNSGIPTFTEYNTQLKFHDVSFYSGHLNSMFYDESSGVSELRLNLNNQSRGLIFTGQNLLIGTNENDQILGVGRRYYSSSPETSNLLLPGPFTPTALNTHENTDHYNRGYYVDRYMIDAHVFAINNNLPNYTMPKGIEFWPGNGNLSIGQAEKLAPFFDDNTNGIYEPMLGDYPKIIGDRCFLNIFHQPEATLYSNSLEIHQYFFSFDCDTSLANRHTFYVKHNYINRSNLDIDSVFIGTFIDFDIGVSSDDYIGTNVDLGIIYGSNGDLYDSPDGGMAGFNDTVPAMGMMILKGPQKKADGTDNLYGGMSDQTTNGLGFGDGIVDNEFIGLSSSVFFHQTSTYPFIDPTDFPSYYYTLQGLNLDGSPMQLGGIDIRHSFFGNSDPNFYSSYGIDHGNNYSEITANNPAGDRRIMGGSGPGELNSGDTIEYLTAYVYGIDTSSFAFPLGVQNLFDHASVIKAAYINNSLGCNSSFDPYIAKTQPLKTGNTIIVFPNPFNSSVQIKGISTNAILSISDINGKQLYLDTIQNNEIIPLESLAKNIYIMKVQDGENVYMKRIVKM